MSLKLEIEADTKEAVSGYGIDDETSGDDPTREELVGHLHACMQATATSKTNIDSLADMYMHFISIRLTNHKLAWKASVVLVRKYVQVDTSDLVNA